MYGYGSNAPRTRRIELMKIQAMRKAQKLRMKVQEPPMRAMASASRAPKARLVSNAACVSVETGRRSFACVRMRRSISLNWLLGLPNRIWEISLRCGMLASGNGSEAI